MRIVKQFTTTTVFVAAAAPPAITSLPSTTAKLEDLVNGILELTDAAAVMAINQNQTSGPEELEFKAGNGGNGGLGGSNLGQAGSVFSTALSQPMGGGGGVQQSDNANGGNGGRGGDVNVIICVSCNNYACPHLTPSATATAGCSQITTSPEISTATHCNQV